MISLYWVIMKIGLNLGLLVQIIFLRKRTRFTRWTTKSHAVLLEIVLSSHSLETTPKEQPCVIRPYRLDCKNRAAYDSAAGVEVKWGQLLKVIEAVGSSPLQLFHEQLKLVHVWNMYEFLHACLLKSRPFAKTRDICLRKAER